MRDRTVPLMLIPHVNECQADILCTVLSWLHVKSHNGEENTEPTSKPHRTKHWHTPPATPCGALCHDICYATAFLHVMTLDERSIDICLRLTSLELLMLRREAKRLRTLESYVAIAGFQSVDR
jgi:hypothetical protein